MIKEGHSFRTNLVSFKTFRRPLFPKPVSCPGLFFAFSYSKTTLFHTQCNKKTAPKSKFLTTTMKTSQNSSKWRHLYTDYKKCIDFCLRSLQSQILDLEISLIGDTFATAKRGRSQTTLTRFWLFLTTYPPALTFSMVWTLTKSGHSKTTYLPCLVNVVCERPQTKITLLFSFTHFMLS